MIDIEQHPLRAFEQDAAPPRARLGQIAPDRADERQHEARDLGQLGEQRGAVDRRLAEAGAQRVVMRGQPIELRPQIAKMREIAHPHRAATHLVFIGGTNTAPGGADLARAARILAQRVEIAVERQDQRTGVGDHQRIRGYLHALAAQLLHLGLQRPGIEHHAIADHRRRAAHDAGREQRELIGVLADDERMPGIMPALEAHDDIGALAEPIDDLALALIAPLGADHRDIGQATLLLLAKPRRSTGDGEARPMLCGGRTFRRPPFPGEGRGPVSGRPRLGPGIRRGSWDENRSTGQRVSKPRCRR